LWVAALSLSSGQEVINILQLSDSLLLLLDAPGFHLGNLSLHLGNGCKPLPFSFFFLKPLPLGLGCL
jgi:hypothetical protein